MIKIMGNQIELLASLGKRLRLLREDRELTQTGIAAMLSSYGVDITPSHLSLVEKNKRNPSANDSGSRMYHPMDWPSWTVTPRRAMLGSAIMCESGLEPVPSMLWSGYSL